MNKITLIIPDLHHRWEQAEKIISAVGADEIIFLGDYFDDFDDTPEMVSETCEWLECSVNNSNRIHLFGNHDQMYAYAYRSLRCSGYADWKYFIIHDTIPRSVWDKVKWYHFLDNRWLLTHGGLHKRNVPDRIIKVRSDRQQYIKDLSSWIDDEIRNALSLAPNGQSSWIVGAGRARWGIYPVGGITWCDFEREFNPFKGMNQIVGHTPQQFGIKWCRIKEDGNVVHPNFDKWSPTPEQLDDPNLSANICLDVWKNTTWAVWNGKELKLGNYKEL